MIKLHFSNDGFTYILYNGEVLGKADTKDFMKDANCACIRSFTHNENTTVEFLEPIKVIS